MTAHVCGTFDQVKRAGCCTCCGEPAYEVREVYADGPLEGHPRRLGPMLDAGCQVTLQLTDGSTADIAFCVQCVNNLRPEHYRALWRACVERGDLSLKLAGRSENERRVARAVMLAKYPVAVVGKRRESEAGVLAVDRR